MKGETIALLNYVDVTFPGGRAAFFEDIVPLISDKVFFSPESLATRYDVSLSCIKTWRAKGLLIPSMKIPEGTTRYTLEDLVDFEKRAGRNE